MKAILVVTLLVIAFVAGNILEYRFFVTPASRLALSDKDRLAVRIMQLCNPPEKTRAKQVYPVNSAYSYQLHCSPVTSGAVAEERDYYIRYKEPYGYLSWQRLIGVSTEDYFRTGAWELRPTIAKLDRNRDILWYNQ